MIVRVIHPVPVIHVPHRSRNERLDVVDIVTPVTIRETVSVNMERVRFPHERAGGEPASLLRNEDAIWEPLADRDGAPLQAAWLAAFFDGSRGDLEHLCRVGLARLEAEAMIGLAGIGEHRPVLQAIAETLTVAWIDDGHWRDSKLGPELLRDAIVELYLPNLPVPELPAEDAEAQMLAH